MRLLFHELIWKPFDEMFNRMSQSSYQPNVMLQNGDANFSYWQDARFEAL